MTEEKTIKTDEDLARLFGVDPGTQTRLVKVRNGDMIDVVEQEIPLEERISRRVYKDTECGAWAKLEEALPVGARVKQEWIVDIRKDKRGFRCVRAHMALPETGEWIPLKDWSADLVEAVAWEEGLDDGYLQDESIVGFLESDVDWDEKGRAGDYFDVAFHTYVGGYAPGVTFGSIVEGVDQCADPVSVTFPCAEADVWEAIQAVEEHASGIWMETHGCPRCWGGEVVANDFGDMVGPDEPGGRPVDPDCKGCNGKGQVI